MQKLAVDPLTWVMAKPIRMATLEALEDVSFLAPGRDFKTMILAMQAKEWNKSIPGEIDRDGVMGSLPMLHRLGLVKRKRKKDGGVVFVKHGRRVETTTTYWRLTSEGIAVLWAARNAPQAGRSPDEVPLGGTGDGEGEGRTLALSEGDDREPYDPQAGEEDEPRHADDAGRSGASADDDERGDPDDYAHGYRRFYRRT